MSGVPTRFDDPASTPPAIKRPALAAGTRLGEFEILRVLGVGGFGIVYLARDHTLQRNVALKEYMPASLAARGVGAEVTIRSPSFAQTYASGLDAFLNEARLLARFDHPSLVKVHRWWEDNATAYMVMPYLQGVTLGDVRRAMSSPPDEAWIRRIVDGILDALELLHHDGVYHRDVAPENILLPEEGPPVLLDFGAARHAIGHSQSFTTMLRLDYAPIEQFVGVKPLHQGPFTDLYALGAVMHFLVFGVPPAPATERAAQEDSGEAGAHPTPAGMSAQLLDAMAWALAVRPNRRPQSAKELRAALAGRIAVPAYARRGLMPADSFAPARTDSPLTSPSPPSGAPRARTAPGLALALLVLLVIGVALAVVKETAPGAGDPGIVSVQPHADIVAGAPAAQPTAVEPLDAATGDVVASPGAVAALSAASEAPVASLPITSVDGHPSALSSVDVDGRSAPTTQHRSGPPAQRLATAPAKRSDSIAAADATRSKPGVKVAANGYVTSNAYMERSAADPFLSARARDPAPQGGPEPPQAKHVARRAGSSKGHAPAAPASAQEACNGRGFFARAVCMDRECEQPLFRASAECNRVLAMKRTREGH
jgi:hypothetical protein